MKKTLVSSLGLLLSTPFMAHAEEPSWLKNVEVSVAAGPTWTNASNGYLKVDSSVPPDLDHVNDVSKSTSYQIGVGYHLFAEQLVDRQFFNDLLVQVNYLHDSATIKGSVWSGGYPQSQRLSFRAPFTSDRLMVDVKPSLFTYANVSAYPIAGLGIAWNNIAYNETAYPAYSNFPDVDCPAATSKNLVYDLGFGFRSKITEHLSATLEYVNTHLGRMQPDNTSTGKVTTIISPPNFPMHSTTVLLGLSWRF